MLDSLRKALDTSDQGKPYKTPLNFLPRSNRAEGVQGVGGHTSLLVIFSML